MAQKSTVDFMMEDLQEQISKLSYEKALFKGMATNKEFENQQLQHELETLKNENEELKKKIADSTTAEIIEEPQSAE
ncbi:hypothetical protein [Bacillus gobiensis]|uniref:Uncharacterized protein n=1 Tax=Bacillus gobiensis TaxID=1441095 RepID=A0A0M5JL39_9BACI|nr:hypothetical protein [Bacillus gobiensis]ALC80451.1 hypothetical protein AM592_01775 [Bacillus gobiensis]